MTYSIFISDLKIYYQPLKLKTKNISHSDMVPYIDRLFYINLSKIKIKIGAEHSLSHFLWSKIAFWVNWYELIAEKSVYVVFIKFKSGSTENTKKKLDLFSQGTDIPRYSWPCTSFKQLKYHQLLSMSQ